MNTITATNQPSRYIPEPHLVALVDGEPLDCLMARLTREDAYRGMVLALDGFSTIKWETTLVWERILPSPGALSYAPLLVCTDCLDLSCTVIVAEVCTGPDEVYWRRLGSDYSSGHRADQVAVDVRWLHPSICFRFPREEYESFLEDCRRMARAWWAEAEPPKGRGHGEAEM